MWRRYTEVGGGPAATAAVAAAAVGAQVDFIDRVNDDTGNNAGGTGIWVMPAIPAATRRPCRRGQHYGGCQRRAVIVSISGFVLTPTGLTTSIFAVGCGVGGCALYDGAKQGFTLARQAGVMTVLDGYYAAGY